MQTSMKQTTEKKHLYAFHKTNYIERRNNHIMWRNRCITETSEVNNLIKFLHSVPNLYTPYWVIAESLVFLQLGCCCQRSDLTKWHFCVIICSRIKPLLLQKASGPFHHYSSQNKQILSCIIPEGKSIVFVIPTGFESTINSCFS